MPFTDAYFLRAVGNYLSQSMVTTMTFERSDSTMHAADLTATYEAIVWQTQRVAMSNSFNLNSIEAQSLSDPLDFHARQPANVSGQASTGDNLSPFIAAGIRFNRTRTDMHHGWVRFSGFREGYIAGTTTTGILSDMLDAVAAALTSFMLSPTLPPGGFYHSVVRRVKYITPSGKVAYRLPQDASEYVAYIPTTYLSTHILTTQNSRKPGRGS